MGATNFLMGCVMKGKIKYLHKKEIDGEEKLNGVTITGDDGNQYYAHLGDFYENEQLIYAQNKVSVKETDEVEFEPFINKLYGRATSVKKNN